MSYVFLCDHATNYIPPELNGLGLPASELERHIAWDIGAAGVTKKLSQIFNAPAIFSTVSRLVIDCNRHLDAKDLIPEISDATMIPGNRNLTDAARAVRIEQFFNGYHNEVEKVLAAHENPIVVSIHSMTPNLAGVPRPWQIALSSYKDRSLADPVLAALRQAGDIVVGDNEPYDLDPAVDYSVPFHAISRGLQHLQVEFRQDEIVDLSGQVRWANRLARGIVGFRFMH